MKPYRSMRVIAAVTLAGAATLPTQRRMLLSHSSGFQSPTWLLAQ